MVMKLRLSSDFKVVDDPEKDPKCAPFVPSADYDAWVDDDMEEAAAICNGDVDGIVCPQRHKCLIFALINNEHYGVWGGLYPQQRHDLRQRYKWRRGMEIPIEWEFDNATPQQDLLDAAEAREAQRAAERMGRDEEA